MSSPKDRVVIVTLNEASLDDVKSKANELQRAGLQVIDILEILGQVTGQWSDPDVAPLLAVDGVESVEDSGEVRLAPPGSTIL